MRVSFSVFPVLLPFIASVVSLSSLFVQLFDVPVYYDRVRPILETLPESSGCSPTQVSSRGAVHGSRQLSLCHHGPLTLDQVGLYADPGEFIAIVGASSSAKAP